MAGTYLIALERQAQRPPRCHRRWRKMRQFMPRPWTWSDWTQAWHSLLSSQGTRSRQPSAASARWALDVALVVEGRRTATLFDASTLAWRECLAWDAWLEQVRC